MAMLITPRNIYKIVKIAILAIIATIVMAIGIFSMAIRIIQFKSMKNSLSDIRFISIGPFV